MIDKHEKNGTTETHDTKILSTVFTSGVFTGWAFIVNWVLDPKNNKKTLHIDFMHGKNSYEKYVDLWFQSSTLLFVNGV